jgi:Large ribosomal RNA subunit accumulation protein YceD
MTSKDKSRPSKSRRRAAGAPAPAGAADFSRIVEVDQVPDAGLQIAIQADAAERAAIAERAGLVAVESLKADLEIAKEGEAKFGVIGALRARIVQTCVVTLEPFESEINPEVAADFAAEVKKSAPRRGRSQDTEAVDDLSQSFAAQLDAPDPIVDGRMNVGALIEEFLILSLDPYPRKPGVRFEGAEFSSNPDAAESPFSVLKKLKDGE